MEQEKIAKEILSSMIGLEAYSQLLTDAVKEFAKDEVYDTDDLEYIMDSYSIAILLIGFSKKQFNIDKYEINFMNKPKVKIDTKKFSKKYKLYIEKVELFKFDLLRKLLC